MGNNDQGNGETYLQKPEAGIEKAKKMQIVSSDGRSVAEYLEAGHGHGGPAQKMSRRQFL